jgi:hypothetical protein
VCSRRDCAKTVRERSAELGIQIVRDYTYSSLDLAERMKEGQTIPSEYVPARCRTQKQRVLCVFLCVDRCNVAGWCARICAPAHVGQNSGRIQDVVTDCAQATVIVLCAHNGEAKFIMEGAVSLDDPFAVIQLALALALLSQWQACAQSLYYG